MRTDTIPQRLVDEVRRMLQVRKSHYEIATALNIKVSVVNRVAMAEGIKNCMRLGQGN